MFNKKYTEKDMVEAVSKASSGAYRFGYNQCIVDVQQVIDTRALGIVLYAPTECFTVKQATAIYQSLEAKGQGLID